MAQLHQSAYDSESVLQHLLAEHPSLLGITCGSDDRLLLVKREQQVPDGNGGNGRWSLDHLLIDRNAVPTMVEVKRSSDTRSRREVVAQSLDYAANGVAHKALTSDTERSTVEEWLARLASRHGAKALEGAERALRWFADQGCSAGIVSRRRSVLGGMTM